MSNSKLINILRYIVFIFKNNVIISECFLSFCFIWFSIYSASTIQDCLTEHFSGPSRQ